MPAYGSIVAAGRNACILHYRENDAAIKDGDLILIDAGCEIDCYASDITRTFPPMAASVPSRRRSTNSCWKPTWRRSTTSPRSPLERGP